MSHEFGFPIVFTSLFKASCFEKNVTVTMVHHILPDLQRPLLTIFSNNMMMNGKIQNNVIILGKLKVVEIALKEPKIFVIQ